MRPQHLLASIALLGAPVGPGCARPQPPLVAELATSPAPWPCVFTSDCLPDHLCAAGSCRPCQPGECTYCKNYGGCISDDVCAFDEICTSVSADSTRGDCQYSTCVFAGFPEEAKPPAIDIPVELSPADHDPDRPVPTPTDLLLAMFDSYLRVHDYTATLVRRQRVDGKLLPEEVIDLKFRDPHALYMRWRDSGREVLYARGKHQDRLRTHPGAPPDVTTDLDPTSAAAMAGNRRPLTEQGLGDFIDIIARDLRRAASRPQDGLQIVDLRGSDVDPRIHCIHLTFTAAAGYHAPRLEVCRYTATNLPSSVRVREHDLTLLESYEYRDLQVNVGLQDIDFDSRNPQYGFHR